MKFFSAAVIVTVTDRRLVAKCDLSFGSLGIPGMRWSARSGP